MGYQTHTLFIFCFLGLALANTEMTAYEKREYGECDWDRNKAEGRVEGVQVCECSHFLDGEERSVIPNPAGTRKQDHCQRKGTNRKMCRFFLDVQGGKRECLIEMIVRQFQYKVGENGVDQFLSETENRNDLLAQVACPDPPNGCTVENLADVVVPSSDIRRRRLDVQSGHERRLAWRRRKLQTQAPYELPNGMVSQSLLDGQRCSNDNLIFNGNLEWFGECAEKAQELNPETEFFSWREDRAKCEIPHPDTAVEACGSLAYDNVPLWTIYEITSPDPVSDLCTISDDCAQNSFCWTGYCMDTMDATVCESMAGIPTDDGWSWDCDYLYNDDNFMCQKLVCETDAPAFSPTTTTEEPPATTEAPTPLCGDCTGCMTFGGCLQYGDNGPGSVEECVGAGYADCSDNIADLSCSSTSECGAGFCNFDDGDSGTCELCEDIALTCADDNFLNEQGLLECVSVCEASARTVTIFERMAVRARMGDEDYVKSVVDGQGFAGTWNTRLENENLGTGVDSGYEVKMNGAGVTANNPCTYYADELCGGSETDVDALEKHRACRNYVNQTSPTQEVVNNCADVGEYCPNEIGSNGILACKDCPASLEECDTEYCRQCESQKVFDYPPDLNKMIRIMADDRGGESSQRVRFEGMKKRIRKALSSNQMLDGSPMFYKSQWRRMQDLTIKDNENYNKNNFHRLGFYLDELVRFWEEKYGRGRYQYVEDEDANSTEE